MRYMVVTDTDASVRHRFNIIVSCVNENLELFRWFCLCTTHFEDISFESLSQRLQLLQQNNECIIKHTGSCMNIVSQKKNCQSN